MLLFFDGFNLPIFRWHLRYKLKKVCIRFACSRKSVGYIIFMLMLCFTQKRWSLAIDKTWPTDTMQRLFRNENVYNTWKWFDRSYRTRNNELEHKRAKTLNDKGRGKWLFVIVVVIVFAINKSAEANAKAYYVRVYLCRLEPMSTAIVI